MISDSEAVRLAAAVTEATGQEFSDAGAVLFASSIDPEMGLNDALHALSEWNRQAHSYYRVQPGELTAIWKSHKPSSRLTEADIGRMLDPLNLTADERWAARRELIANVNRGIPQDAALSGALDKARGRLLPSKPSRPKPTNNHHFAGRLQLNDVIGKDVK